MDRIKAILNSGYPFLVLKVEASKKDIEKALSGMYNKKVSIIELGNQLAGVDKNKEIRVSPSFSPSYWWEPGAMGTYSWPFYSLVKEVSPKLMFKVMKYDDSSRQKFMAYTGLGIVAFKEELVGGSLLKSGEPVAIALVEPLKPRRIAVFERRNNKIICYSACEPVVTLLKKYRYRGVYSFLHEKNYKNEKDMANELWRIKMELTSKGIPVFMLGDLDKVVKMYREVIASSY